MNTPQQTYAFDNLCWQSNKITAPCQSACPLGTDVAGYVMATMMGKYDEAFRIITENNPLPGVSSRICHHPCESECIRGKIDHPIAVRALKRFALKNTGKKARQWLPAVLKASGKHVAVVGSGPAGLAAAYDLSVMGHDVSVFEKDDRPGGMLSQAIPSFILPRRVLESDLMRIRELGVIFQTGIEIQGAAGIRNLFESGFSAVLLATGAHGSVMLESADYTHPNIMTGLSFLKDAADGGKDPITGRVLVIGGGNVAIDVARVCIRKGADHVDIHCIEKSDEMPAFAWEIERALAEGVIFTHESSLIHAAENEDGALTCRFARVDRISKDSHGGLVPVIDMTRTALKTADFLFIAAGQRSDVEDFTGLSLKPATQKPLHVALGSEAADFAGLFAAGDLVRLPGTFVDAVAGGKKAAGAINDFLDGPSPDHGHPLPPAMRRLESIPECILDVFPKRERRKIPEISPENAKKSFKEVERAYSPSAAVREASRCLNCAVCGNCMYERMQLCRETGLRLF